MINVIVSGLGRIAWRYHLPQIKADQRFNLLAISDPVEERRNEAAAEYPGINTYADFDEMLAAEKSADMVVIASPTMFHKPQTVAALERGLKILEMLSEHPSGLLMGEMKELQLPAASLYRMLVTLTELGYIIRDEHDRYHLGRKLQFCRQ